MLLTSKLNGKKWIWAKIPKTGTRAYSKLFFPEGTDEFFREDGNRYFHLHFAFTYLYNHHQQQHPGFTVVRHPVTRFISALKHLADLNSECIEDKCINHPGNIPWNNIDEMVEFLYDSFERNCIPKNNKSYSEIFGVDFTNYYDSFFRTQVHWVYHPKMKWFYYENLEEYNVWLHETFGFDIKNLERVGEIKKNHLEHLDFTNPKFIQVVEHLFYDDYHAFNYPFQYLT